MTADIHLPAEHDKPEIDFRFSQHRLAIRGESYPENAAQFYSPLVAAVGAYLGATQGAQITVDVDLIYFNSSSTKVLLGLFEMLNKAGERNKVVLNWHFDPEDETVQEFGADLAEDCDMILYVPQEKVA
jgi:hypothetical protein